ncbi:uncharacterized protein AB9W97_015105 isoform 2-T2 [Spinachia spinachia]
MQLHACLLLFIITTDKTLALPDPRCGGHVSLGERPAGLLHLSSPGAPTGANHQSAAVSVCTWTLGVPPGRRVLLKLVRLDAGWSTVSCVVDEGDRVLESGGAVLLWGCDGHKAAFTWTGAGRHSNEVQLSYNVQEDERNSSVDHTGPRSGLHRWTPTGTRFTSAPPVGGQHVARGADGGLFEDPHRSSGPRPASSPSSRDQGPLHTTSPPRGPSSAGRADRETLPLPEEGPNNGAETSGAARHADGKMPATDGARLGFQPTDSLFDRTHAANTRAGSSASVHLFSFAWEGGASGEEQPHSWRSHRSTAGLNSDPTSAVTSDPPKPPAEPRQGDSRGLVTELETDSSARQRAALQPSDGLVILHAFTSSTGSRTNPPAQNSAPSGTTSDAGTPTAPLTYTPSRDRWPANLPTPDTLFPAGASTRPSTLSHVLQTLIALPRRSNLTQAPLSRPSATAEPLITHDNAPRALQTIESAYSPTPHVQNRVSVKAPVTLKQPRNRVTAAPMTLLSPTTANTHSGHGGEEEEGAEREGESGQWSPSSRTTPTSTTGPSSTGPPSTKPPSTLPPSTKSISAVPPSTVSPSTVPPLTGSPSTVPPSTVPPSNGSPSTVPRSTGSPSTVPPSTVPPSTASPSTGSPSTVPPLTGSPSTVPPSTMPPLTMPPLTMPHSTGFPSTVPPSTGSPSTVPPSTGSPSTVPPSTVPPLTVPPSTGSPSTVPPSTVPPLTVPPSTGSPSTVPPSTASPSTGSPSTVPPSTVPPSTGSPSTKPPSTRPQSTGPPSWTASYPGQGHRSTPTPPALTSTWSPAARQTPDFYIVPDQPSAIRVESVELLLQIVVEDSRSFASGLEDDAAAWVELYLRKAPGFSGLVGVWSSGHAVQSLVGFRTSGALRWLGATGPASLLERTGLAQAVREGRSFHSSKITNITLGGVQGDVCDWLLQCPEGYECVFNPGASNYSCSSRCHFDYCHHRGICTHHPGQLPVCRCLVGEDFWFMGGRCDVRMTRARLVGTCFAALLVMAALIGVLALVAVRRYRAILIQAKVDQTRSSYRRFNHFDELSGRFWLRSWAGSADSLDNPAFTRSDELLHLRALDRPCCYHDDTLSLASTCPSHGARINTIYPHSSQYGWRGSELSVADGVLDSGKASDLSVCSWPVEPIQWTPFPLLQQLASHRTPGARVSRPRSYCEGMELADMGKSWTA